MGTDSQPTFTKLFGHPIITINPLITTYLWIWFVKNREKIIFIVLKIWKIRKNFHTKN